jgi:hypothetical protein
VEYLLDVSTVHVGRANLVARAAQTSQAATSIVEQQKSLFYTDIGLRVQAPLKGLVIESGGAFGKQFVEILKLAQGLRLATEHRLRPTTPRIRGTPRHFCIYGFNASH